MEVVPRAGDVLNTVHGLLCVTHCTSRVLIHCFTRAGTPSALPHLTPHPLTRNRPTLTSPRTPSPRPAPPHLNPRPPLRGPLWLRKDQLFPHLRAHNGPHRRPGHADHPATHQARPAPPPIKPPPTDSTRKEGLMPRIGRPRPTPSRKPCTWRTGSSSCKVAHPTESLDTSQRLSMCPSARTVPSPPPSSTTLNVASAPWFTRNSPSPQPSSRGCSHIDFWFTVYV